MLSYGFASWDIVLTHNRLARQASASTPSGIAQLRKSSDQRIGSKAESSEAINLDDYIFSDNVSTPLGLGKSPSPELNKKDADKTNHAVASAIPIKMRKESSQFAVPQSVPVPHHNPRHNEEFNYVQRHVRKTSIDERRVSTHCSRLLDLVVFCGYATRDSQTPLLTVHRPGNDLPTSLLKYLPPTR
jgi:hypothetical protein